MQSNGSLDMAQSERGPRLGSDPTSALITLEAVLSLTFHTSLGMSAQDVGLFQGLQD